MVSDRLVRISHTILFTLVLVASIICLAISASLVSHYNSDGYPPEHTGAYKARIRILLVASIWTVVFGIALTVGFQMAGRKQIFGILSHLVPMTLGWILFLIGSASLTGLTSKIDCGRATDTFSRCGITKGLVVVSWIDTIILTVTLAFIVTMAFVARAGYGVHKSTMYAE